MSKKSVKFAKAQRPAGASTSAEHPGTERHQSPKAKGPSTGVIIGASLLAVGAGVLIALTRRSWPIKEAQEAATGLFKGKSKGQESQGQAVKGVDPDLNAEVASATQSSPQTQDNFTDEGATGNND